MRVPRLEDTSAGSIRSFITAYLIYSSSGKKHILDLMLPETWVTLQDMLAVRSFDPDIIELAKKRGEDSLDACLACLRGACVPGELVDQAHHMDDLHLSSASEEAALVYAREFLVRCEELEAIKSVLASDKKFLLRTFTKNITHRSLRDEFHMRCGSAPDSVDMTKARRLLLEAVFYLKSDDPAKSFGNGDNRKNKQKHVAGGSAGAGQAGKAKPRCQAHPESKSHTWEECSKNPKNAKPSATTATGSEAFAASKPASTQPAASGQSQWSRDKGQRLVRAQLLRQTLRNEQSAVLPRVLGITVHTGSRPQRHVAFVDTGSDCNAVNKKTAQRLLELGCKAVDLPAKELTLFNGTSCVADQALQLDVTIYNGQQKEHRCTETFLVMDCPDDFVLGYPLVADLAQRGCWIAPQPSAQADTSGDPPSIMDDLDAPSATTTLEDLKIELPETEKVGREKLQTVLARHINLFRLQAPSDVIKMEPINLELDKPFPKQHPRQIPRAHQPIVNAMVREWVKDGIAAPSTSPHSNNLVLVSKKEGDRAVTTADTARLCMDLRALNECFKDFPYPLPLIRDTLDTVAGHQWYAVVDLRSAFLQIPLSPATSQLLAFTTSEGHYEMRRMPFGVKTAPAILQSTISNILAGLVNVTCTVYMDDCCVFADSVEELAQRLDQIFDRFQKANVIVKGSKCIFGARTIKYLGHVVSAQGVAMDPTRVEGLTKLPAPTSKEQLHSFLGAAGWFRRFVPRFAMLSHPLSALLHKGVPYHWGEKQDRAFHQLTKAIAEATLLHAFSEERTTILRTDACNYGIAAMLLQVDTENTEYPVGFFSRMLKGPELMYSTVEQEALGIICAVQHFDFYLRGHHFIIETDSKNNTFIQTANNPKVARWRLMLQNYDFELRHIPGRENVVSDYLSRAFGLAQFKDRLQQVHSATTGHLGINATIRRLNELGWTWPTMRQDVTTYIQRCPICVKTRINPAPLEGEVRSVEVWEPFEVVSVDFIGPFTKDGDGNSYIVCCIDDFTRFVELTAHKDCSAFSAAQALLAVFARYGAPLEVRSDQGPHFSAEIIRQFLGLCDARHRFSLPYHPQANGPVERAIQECNRHLRALVCEWRVLDNWSSFLPLVQRIMNSVPHSATGVAPATLLYGNHCNPDRNLFCKPSEELETSSVSEYLQQLIQTQRQLVEVAQRTQAAQLDRRIDKANPEHPASFKVDDTIMLRPPHDRPRNKLAPRLLGPYIVVAKTGTNTYTIRPVNSTLEQDRFEVHLERMVPFRMSADVDADQLLAADQGEEYLVEEIRQHRRLPGKTGNAPSAFEYLVKWTGYDELSWEPSSSFTNNSIFKNYLIIHNIGRKSSSG